jgi:broad-specificity NMP kinase
MINMCLDCGEYRADKVIDQQGPYAICPACGYKNPFVQLPLLIVSGASGTGKSTVCRYLTGTITEAVLLDSDILWRDEFNQPETDYRSYFEMWLRVCKNISQSGRPVVLFGAGMGVPSNVESCIERRYFSAVHYLALTCEDEALEERLRSRPKWRTRFGEEFIVRNNEFNRWFKKDGHRANPAVTLLDTTGVAVPETSAEVVEWLSRTAGIGD